MQVLNTTMVAMVAGKPDPEGVQSVVAAASGLRGKCISIQLVMLLLQLHRVYLRAGRHFYCPRGNIARPGETPDSIPEQELSERLSETGVIYK